jgi:hypothetical protein
MSQQITLELNNNRRALDPELNDGQSFQPVTIRFKLVYTTTIRFYTICPDWTTRQLKEFIRPYVSIDFALEDFDIVETRLQGDEQARPIQISSNIKVRDVLSNMSYLCMYIRPRLS